MGAMAAPTFDFDAELQRYQPLLREAAAVGPGDTVLDLGCGSGATTREAARLAVRGSALGVDVSAPRVEAARRLAVAENVTNVRFELADAQTHPFPDAHFSLAFSRLGTMFFANPVTAFANVARALRPGGRLVQLVWQARDRQEWVSEISRAVGNPPVPHTSPFTLGDPAVVREVLTTAGFSDVQLAGLSEPLYYGPDPATAADVVRPLQLVSTALDPLDESETSRALDRLREVMAEHHTADGVWLGSRAWLITARRGA